MLFELGNVGAGDEGSTGSGQNDAANRRIIARGRDRVAQFRDHAFVERVQLVGSVDCHRRDAIGDGERDGFVSHEKT